MEFTPATLGRFDGTDPHQPVLIAYRGRVYDVSGRFMWMNGRHFWLRAGRDLTGHIHEAPHGEVMLRNVPCVGVLVPDGEEVVFAQRWTQQTARIILLQRFRSYLSAPVPITPR